MYKCSFCERLFSRKQDLTQHNNQLHSSSKHSRILSWVQGQQLNFNITSQQKPLQKFDNDIWNDNIEGFGISSQITSIGSKQNNEVFAILNDSLKVIIRLTLT